MINLPPVPPIYSFVSRQHTTTLSPFSHPPHLLRVPTPTAELDRLSASNKAADGSAKIQEIDDDEATVISKGRVVQADLGWTALDLNAWKLEDLGEERGCGACEAAACVFGLCPLVCSACAHTSTCMSRFVV